MLSNSNIYFCSDPHFYHEKMATLRGFSSIEEYHNFFISEWNNTVSKRDVVYILGDITMETKKYDILDKLNGIKKVVLGNHDKGKRSHTEELLKHVNTIQSSVKMEIGEYTCLLTHIPVHPIEFDYRIDFNIHGHLHKLEVDDKRYINVCPERVGYIPLNINEVYAKLKELR